MTTRKNSIPSSTSTIIPEVFSIYKKAGELKTCRYVEKPADVPAFLMEAGAVSITADGHLKMIAKEGPAIRSFPVYLKWEKSETLKAGYGAWPKDNGDETLNVAPDGRCFDKAARDEDMPRYLACRLTNKLPEPFASKKSISFVTGKCLVCEVKTTWGETRKAELPSEGFDAVLVEYEDGGANIVAMSESSAYDYFIELNGKTLGKMVDLLIG